MSRIPRSVGIPPLSDGGFEQAFTSQAALTTSAGLGGNGGPSLPSSDGMLLFPSQPSVGSYEEGGQINNPLAGMGLSDEQYSAMLQNMMNGQGLLDGIGNGMGGQGERMRGREKRRFEWDFDEDGDGRDEKRGRFEVIE